jgi:phosphohistidine swiveling domain-containing protein
LPAAFADDDLLPASWSQVQAHLERMRRAAAIVARELGIPAVVGCNDATMRLHTGDRVRVDGGQGTVEILGS